MSLLTAFVAAYPAQPATAFWRAIEIDAFRRNAMPEGLGLDVGCGDGKLTKIIREHTPLGRLVGIDLDPEEVSTASLSGVYDEVQTCPAAEMPFPNARFDFALSNSVLEHIPDVGRVLSEVARVTKPGAIFGITVPTVGFHANLSGPLMGGGRQRYLAEIDARLAHFHYFSATQWREMLHAAGFELKEVFGYLDLRECRRWETLSRITGGLLYKLAGSRIRPIDLQRNLGLRQVQNRFSLPRPVAYALASLYATGHKDTPAYWGKSGGLPDQEAGCLMLTAVRRDGKGLT